MRGLGDIVVANLDLRADLALDTATLVNRLNDPSYYPPEKRIVLALAVIERIRTKVRVTAEAMQDRYVEDGSADIERLHAILELVR